MQAGNNMEKEAISITSDGPKLIRARDKYGDLKKNHEFREGWALSPQN
jgi:hypothetical protein